LHSHELTAGRTFGIRFDPGESFLLLAAVPFLLRSTRLVTGISIRHAASVQVGADEPLVTLDGEIAGILPCSFDIAGDALRVIVPPGFTDV
jgi:diacylglycerol kinase family enzyme